MGNKLRQNVLCGISALALTATMVNPCLLKMLTARTTLEPIVVTGEKTRRSMKDTASSVSVKTKQEIEKERAGDASVTEVLADVPNVVYPDSVSAPVIRGQDTQGPNTGATAFFAGTVPRATINIDGHYLNYNEFYFGATSVWDLESIEVFRGPQTTSQGANAIAVPSL